MKILFVTRRYRPFAGGSENQIARVAEALRKQNHTIRVLTGRYDRNLDSDEEKSGVIIQRLPDPAIRIVGTVIFLLYLIREMLHRSYYDIVIATMINETSSVAILMSKLMGKKVFFRVSSKNNFKKEKLYRKLVFLADGMIAQTEELKQEAIHFGYAAEKITVIPNMITEDAFIERGKKSPLFHILWCGRLYFIKNPMLLVDIAEHMKKAGLPFCIDIVGNGDLRSSFESEIKRRNLSECFCLHGFQKDTRQFYKSADLYLITSDSDAMPNTVLEAMAAALPIVATDVGGIPILVRDEKEALLFPVGNAEQAVKKIKRLFNDPALAVKLGQNARQRAHDCFLEHSVVIKYCKLLSNPD